MTGLVLPPRLRLYALPSASSRATCASNICIALPYRYRSNALYRLMISMAASYDGDARGTL
eukprot:scaffold136780_cov232-Phaeocystis_antarctica.AAC.1